MSSSIRCLALTMAMLAGCADGGAPEATAPSILAAVPASVIAGSRGTSIVLSGRGFTSASRIRWNETERPTTYISDHELRVALADSDFATARVAALVVVNSSGAGGTSSPLQFVVENPRPALVSISPDYTTTGATRPTVSLTGANFVETSQALVNGQPRNTIVLSPTLLFMYLTPSDVASAGTFTITVTNPSPGGGTSQGATFTVKSSPPGIYALSPSTAAVGATAFELVVFGSDLLPEMLVQWNGKSRPTTYWSSIRLSTIVQPEDLPSVGTAAVRAVNPATGDVTNSLPFTITQFAAPQISGFAPGVGVIGSNGLTLTVQGTNFRPGMVVYFGSSPRPTTFVSPTALTVAVPASDLAAARVWELIVRDPQTNQMSPIVYFVIALTDPPGPTTPVPASLWRPPVGATPASGNFFYLESEAGDRIGGGRTQLITSSISILERGTVLAADVEFSVGSWVGEFETMDGLTRFLPGYYGNIGQAHRKSSEVGGLDWKASSSTCGSVTGWFVVDEVTYTAGAMSSLAARFEQHCDGATAALRGAMRWVK